MPITSRSSVIMPMASTRIHIQSDGLERLKTKPDHILLRELASKRQDLNLMLIPVAQIN